MQARKEEEAAFGKPDADGFIMVQRRGKKKLADGNIHVSTAKVTPDLVAKSKEEKVVMDFYRFQRRENRRKRNLLPPIIINNNNNINQSINQSILHLQILLINLSNTSTTCVNTTFHTNLKQSLLTCVCGLKRTRRRSHLFVRSVNSNLSERQRFQEGGGGLL